MKKFTNLTDIGGAERALQLAKEVKAAPFADQNLGRNKTLLAVFFNSSLRTRLSTQRAAQNLGMNCIVLDIDRGAWRLETERGVVMDGDKPEHIREAIPVMASYCDIIGVRAFAELKDRERDYKELILSQFIELSGRPVFSMEGATGHPLQSYADLITIDEHRTVPKPRILLTWAPHPNALPQAVPNSFAEWMVGAGFELIVANPEGYDLAPEFTRGARVVHDPDEGFHTADFVYAKNWSSFEDYGKVLSRDKAWTVDERKMALTDNAFFMHCLPVRRGMIVTDGVIESPRSLVIPEAANRVVSAQAVLREFLHTL